MSDREDKYGYDAEPPLIRVHFSISARKDLAAYLKANLWDVPYDPDTAFDQAADLSLRWLAANLNGP